MTLNSCRYGVAVLSLISEGKSVANKLHSEDARSFYFYQEWENISKTVGSSLGGTLINVTG